MPGREHALITERAVALLPQWQEARIRPEKENLIRRHCGLPDRYFDPRDAEAGQYYFATDGIQFHYIPDTPIVPLYRYYVHDDDRTKLRKMLPYENENWRHASRGMAHYVRQSAAALREGRLKDGLCHAGCLLHFLQDACFGAHSLEGPYGTDIFVLNRYFPEPEDPGRDPFSILSRSPDPPSVEALRTGYAPRFLGYEAEEVALHLYARYVATASAARRLCLRIVTQAYEDREAENVALFHAMYRGAIYLCADVLYTLLCMAERRLPRGAEAVARVPLSDLEPIERPWLVGFPYRTVAMLRDESLNVERERVPLALLLPDGSGGHQRQSFFKGWGMGPHFDYAVAYEIPAGVYGRFSCAIGLHADAVAKGRVRLRLSVGGTAVCDEVFCGANPARRIEVERPAGRIELRILAEDGLNGPYNNIAWADPVLERLPVTGWAVR